MRIKLWAVGLMIIASVSISGSVSAEPPPGDNYVCVRNFLTGVRAADEPGNHFVRVVPADGGDLAIITKKYPESMCSSAPKEFKMVRTMSGDAVCTVDFHQPGVSEYCYSNPKIFSWADAARQ